MYFIAQRTSLARLIHELLRSADHRIAVSMRATACSIEGLNGERWSPGNGHFISLRIRVHQYSRLSTCAVDEKRRISLSCRSGVRKPMELDEKRALITPMGIERQHDLHNELQH